MSDLQFGITIVGGSPVRESARRLEELGFDSLWVSEHVVWRAPMFDALMILAAAASVTTRVRLGTAIVLLPLKHPILVSKAVTTLDHLSGGRASLGIGVGGEYPIEFEAMGVAREERGARANESLELMKRLWTESAVTFKGRFFQVEDLTLEPRPVQQPHPPILVGGRRGALSRTARYADGWMPYMYTPEMYRDDWQKIEEMAHEAGRDPARIERALYVFTSIAESYEVAAEAAARALGATYAQDFNRLVRKYPIVGTPQQCAERIDQFRQAGVRHFIFAPAGPPDRAQEFPEVLANEVIPLVHRGGSA
ncbi:MAG: LLM class flavin-dependent oxidoreductase [Dehalococcoidia bacterium]